MDVRVNGVPTVLKDCDDTTKTRRMDIQLLVPVREVEISRTPSSMSIEVLLVQSDGSTVSDRVALPALLDYQRIRFDRTSPQ